METGGSRLFVWVLVFLQPWSALVRGEDHAQLVSGDVMLAAMFGINVVDGEGCGAYDVNVLKRIMAAQWFLETLNGRDYFGNGVRLGLTVYRTCQSQGRAMTNTVDILNRFHVLSPQSAQTANSTAPLLGFLGPDRTEEVTVVSRFLSSLPLSRRPLQISASATGEILTNKDIYSNLYRVIPPDSIQVEVLLKLLKALHWNYIAIIYDDHDYGRLAFDHLRRLAVANHICVPFHTQVPLDPRRKEFAEKAGAITDVVRDKMITGIVFIGSRATAREFLIKLQTRALFPRFIFSEAVGLEDSVFMHVNNVLSLTKGAFVVTPPSRALPEFRHFWNDVWSNRTLFMSEAERNPWLGQYFHELNKGCSAEDDNCWSNSLSRRPLLDDNTRWLFEYYNVKGVAVFAVFLKKLTVDYCQGQGLCTKLREVLMNERQTVQKLLQTYDFNLEEEFLNVTSAFKNSTFVSFDDDGEVVEHGGSSAVSKYDVYNFQRCQNDEFCFKKVGYLKGDDQLHLNISTVKGYSESGEELTSPNLPKAQCSKNTICTDCLPSDIADEIIIVQGDIYFVAVASVYDRDRDDALGCGPIRTSSGADMVQGILFALQKVNNADTGIFRGGKKLGVIILNACFRELVIKRKLMELYSGKLMLPDGRNSSAILPHIAGYLGAFYSTISVAVYEVLSKVAQRFVLLSPTNTSPNLSDREKYPFYLRLTTKSDEQARAMLDIVRRLKTSYVQVIYDSEDDYSSGLKEAIVELGHQPSFNVCVIQSINTTYDDDHLVRVRERMLQYSWVSVVIVLLQYEHVRNFTNIVTTAVKPGQFVFIGSETWERRQELIDPVDGKEKRLEGSLVLYQGLPVDKQFDDYFKQLDPFSSTNPWLRYFWEAAEDCYFQDSFEKKDKTPCDLGKSGDMRKLTRNYMQSVWVPFYIIGVKVFAEGLHSAMMAKCQALSLCDQLTAEALIQHLKEVRMDITGNRDPHPVFDYNGDGGLGYDVYQVQRQNGRLTYVKVGSYLNGIGSPAISPPIRHPGTA
ncbi:uncharacterized protein LOC143299032 [Babylonia areolata]|uniref:uncharacterized protein LOC143299032 n=1 Tax=Babylonia areolata TaxID=304850 RepID=UPI003FD5BAE0